MLRKLDARAHSRDELARALEGKEVPSPVAERVLDRFEELGLVDDADFAARWTASRHGARGLSRRAVGEELRRKGVEREVIDSALAQISEDDELEAATDLARRKWRAGAGVPQDRLTRRVLAALARKGYGPDQAWQALRRVRAEFDDEVDPPPPW